MGFFNEWNWNVFIEKYFKSDTIVLNSYKLWAYYLHFFLLQLIPQNSWSDFVTEYVKAG